MALKGLNFGSGREADSVGFGRGVFVPIEMVKESSSRGG